jgi:hypothetical protein
VAEKNVSLGAVGVQVDKTGTVRLAIRAKIAEGGKLAAALAEVKPGGGEPFAGLPGGGFVFAGGMKLSEAMIGPLMDFSTTMMKNSSELYGINAEQADKLSEAGKENLKAIHSMSIVMKSGRTGDPLYSNIFGAFRVDDADQFLTGYEKQITTMQEILKDAKEGMLKAPSVKKIEIGGKPALELEITVPVPKAAGNPMADKMMDAMFGKDKKMTAYVAKADDKTLWFSAGASQDKLVQVMAQSNDEKKGLSADKDVAATIGLLPAGAQGEALISIRGYVSLIQRIMVAAMGENFPASKIPPFPKCPPCGVALEAAPRELAVELVIPTGLIKSASEYVGTIRQAMMGGAQPPTP